MVHQFSEMEVGKAVEKEVSLAPKSEEEVSLTPKSGVVEAAPQRPGWRAEIR